MPASNPGIAHTPPLPSGQHPSAPQATSTTPNPQATATSTTPNPTRNHHTTCSLDCPDSCRVIATEDLATGKLIRLTGDPSHPVTRGFLCGKVARYLDRVYAPDRLLHPMRRRLNTPKGALKPGRELDAFEPISWDTALSTIAERFQQIAAKHGPESILPYSYAGTIGALNYGSMDRRFFHRLGASQLDRTICATAGATALTDVYGTRIGMEPQSFAKSKLILAWGANIHGNNIHLWPFIEQARRNGATLIVIDPYETKTARLADQHLRIRPGTDVLLAMGLMHLILRDGLEDTSYIGRNTHGFRELRDRVLKTGKTIYDPENVARITGLAQADIEALAHAYATTRPAAIRVNYGVQRSESGGTAVRAIAMLPLLTGAWQHPGGGLLLSTSGAFPLNKARLEMPELALASPLGRPARTVNMSRLGHALTELGQGPAHPEDSSPAHPGDGPPVHALYVYNSNPAAIAPNQTAVLRGLQRPDLFTVVHDVTLTDTADYADILLPAPTFLEQTDIQGAYGHFHLQLSPAAIPPRGEARSNIRVFADLARHMGFPEACFQDTEDDLIDQALDIHHPWFQGITRASLEQSLSDVEPGLSEVEQSPSKVEPGNIKTSRIHETNGKGFAALHLPRNPVGDFLPFSTPDWFRTPSGRGEFFSETRAAAGLDPLPAYLPGEEGIEAETPAFPLQLLPRKADQYMNSTFADLPRHRAMEAGRNDTVELHPTDAATRHIAENDIVQITSARGSVQLRARLSTRVNPGVVTATLGWNKLAADGNGINILTSERLTDIGAAATFYSTRVQLTRLPTPLATISPQ